MVCSDEGGDGRLAVCVSCLSGLALPAYAHIGSKDVYEEVNAGPYKLFVTIRTPNVIPGVATIEVRSSGATVSSIRITPTPLTGEASKHPPSSDAMQAFGGRPGLLYRVAVADGFRFVAGALRYRRRRGQGEHQRAGCARCRFPFCPCSAPLGIMLALLGILLVVGIAGIVAAAVGQSRLESGCGCRPNRAPPGTDRRAASRWPSPCCWSTAVTNGGTLEATSYAADIYHPLSLSPTLSGNTLDLKIGRHDTDAMHTSRARSNDDLLPDHGHVMHLYAIRQPGMDAAFHLHPALVSPGDLRMTLPSMPPGTYRLYADIVHANGFPETLTADLIVPADLPPAPLAAEDASAAPPAVVSG